MLDFQKGNLRSLSRAGALSPYKVANPRTPSVLLSAVFLSAPSRAARVTAVLTAIEDGLGQTKVTVKCRHIQATLRDLTVIAIIAAASVLLAISTDNSFFVPIFATEAVAAIYLALWIGSARA